MKIFYLTTQAKELQGDYSEVMTLIGLRNLIGENVIDIPRKKVVYKDFSETPRETLHGKGFTLYDGIVDIPNSLRDFNLATKEDIILYGTCLGEYQNPRFFNLEKKVKKTFWVDGQDNPYYSCSPCFKREIHNSLDASIGISVFSHGFSIPTRKIFPIDISIKDQLYQQTTPSECFDGNISGPKGVYLFSTEEDYYYDIRRSWFGLSCKKGGWDCLRHYEILACGSVLLFKNYNKKPKWCSPLFLPCLSYSTDAEAQEIMNKLVIDNKPTDEYIQTLIKQRNWLFNHGTCEAAASKMLNVLTFLQNT